MATSTTPRVKSEKFRILDAVGQFELDFDDCIGTFGVAVIYFDLDHFKALNTRFTEPVVDRDVLPKLQRLICSLVEGHGFAYAEGGDEYVITLRNCESTMASAFTTLLLARIRSCEFSVEGATFQVTASAGIATSSKRGTATSSREAASKAKQAAKNAGRDRYVLLSEEGADGGSSGLVTIDANKSILMLDSKLFTSKRIDDGERETVVSVAVDGPSEAAIRGLTIRARIEVTYGSHWLRGTFEHAKFTYDGSQQIAVVTISRREDDRVQGHDVSWGGNGPSGSLSAAQIAKLRAQRLLTGEPKSDQNAAFGGVEMLIRGMGQDGIAVPESPIPGFLKGRLRKERQTWEHLRLELVRQLILSRCVDRIEALRLRVRDERLVRVELKGFRHSPYSNSTPMAIEINADVDF